MLPHRRHALNNVRIDHTSIDNLKVFYERDIAPETELSKDILRIFSTNNDADTYNSEYNYEYLKKFFISVIWRMSVSKLEHFCHYFHTLPPHYA